MMTKTRLAEGASCRDSILLARSRWLQTTRTYIESHRRKMNNGKSNILCEDLTDSRADMVCNWERGGPWMSCCDRARFVFSCTSPQEGLLGNQSLTVTGGQNWPTLQPGTQSLQRNASCIPSGKGAMSLTQYMLRAIKDPQQMLEVAPDAGGMKPKGA